jgi:hypothetical protein
LLSGDIVSKAVDENFHYPSTTPNPSGMPVNLVNQVEGIKSNYNFTVGINGNYKPVEGRELHAYYNYEQIYYNSLGNVACADSNAPPLCTGSAGYFQNKDTSGVNTVGLGAEWQATNRLKLGSTTFFPTVPSCSASSMASLSP